MAKAVTISLEIIPLEQYAIPRPAVIGLFSENANFEDYKEEKGERTKGAL